jgi:uncharacterized membrane protein required for colicin V production
MHIDLCLLAMVLVFGLFGMLSGAIRQVTHWGGLLGGWLLAAPVAGLLTPVIAKKYHLHAAMVRVGLEGLLFCGIAAVVGVIVHWFLAKHSGLIEDGRVDHGLGFALGVGKSGVLLYALISVILYYEKPLIKMGGKPGKEVEESRVVNFTRRHNLLSVVPLHVARRLEKLADAAKDPKAAQAALGLDPNLQALIKDPKVKAALKDDAFLQALQSGDMAAIQNDPKLKSLLDDPRLKANKLP